MKIVYLDSLFGLVNKSVYYGLRVLIIFLYSKSAATNDFAAFVYVLNIVEIARLLIDFGIDSTYTRTLATMSAEESKQCVEVILSQKLIISIIAGILIVVLSYWLGVTANLSLLIATALILPVISVNSFISIYFQSKNTNKLLLVYYVSGFLFSVVLIYSLQGRIEFFFVYALMEIIFFIVLLYGIFLKTRFTLRIVSLRECCNTYRASFYNGSSQVVVTSYYKTDLLFIQRLSSSINVAYYGFFMRIMDPLLMIASALATSAYSFFSRHISITEKKEYAPKLRQYLLVTIIYAAFILSAITFLLPQVLGYVESKYQISISLAFFFGLATAVRIISAALGGIQLSMGKFRYTFKIALINILTLFPLYFLLIPSFDLKGVLVSIIISELVCVAIKAYGLKKIIF